MHTITIASKGRITLRKELLRHLGVEAGAKISIEMLPDREVRIRAVKTDGRISDVFGILKREGQKPVSIEEMNEAIARGWAGLP